MRYRKQDVWEDWIDSLPLKDPSLSGCVGTRRTHLSFKLIIRIYDSRDSGRRTAMHQETSV